METIVIIRPSFKRFCGDDACRAGLFNHLLYWIARKAVDQSIDKIQNGEVYWYGSAEEICAGLADSWSINKVRKELKAVVDAGLIGRRHNPLYGWDHTWQYFVGLEQGVKLQEAFNLHAIDVAQLDLPFPVLYLLNAIKACSIDLPNLVDRNNKFGRSEQQKSRTEAPNRGSRSNTRGNTIPKVPTKITTKRTDKEAPSPSPENNLEERPRRSTVKIVKEA
jgi:hypothetical protein